MLCLKLVVYGDGCIIERCFSRLHMKTSPFPSTPGSARKGIKRRITTSDQVTRTSFRNEASAKGDVHVSEIDVDGQFVRLENKSEQVCQAKSFKLVACVRFVTRGLCRIFSSVDGLCICARIVVLTMKRAIGSILNKC